MIHQHSICYIKVLHVIIKLQEYKSEEMAKKDKVISFNYQFCDNEHFPVDSHTVSSDTIFSYFKLYTNCQLSLLHILRRSLTDSLCTLLYSKLYFTLYGRATLLISTMYIVTKRTAIITLRVRVGLYQVGMHQCVISENQTSKWCLFIHLKRQVICFDIIQSENNNVFLMCTLNI